MTDFVKHSEILWCRRKKSHCNLAAYFRLDPRIATDSGEKDVVSQDTIY